MKVLATGFKAVAVVTGNAILRGHVVAKVQSSATRRNGLKGKMLLLDEVNAYLDSEGTAADVAPTHLNTHAG